MVVGSFLCFFGGGKRKGRFVMWRAMTRLLAGVLACQMGSEWVGTREIERTYACQDHGAVLCRTELSFARRCTRCGGGGGGCVDQRKGLVLCQGLHGMEDKDAHFLRILCGLHNRTK